MLPECKRINTRKKLKEWLDYETQIYGGCSLLRYIFPITQKDILCKHQVLLRKAEYYSNINNKIMSYFYKILLYRLQNKYCLHIPINCCEKGLKIMHVGPILMNGNVSVGQNCVFHINTALVAGGVNNGVPVLGNGVIMGIGSIAVGNVYIEDNVAIGAHSVVLKDVTEKNICVAGIPAKKISNNGRLSWNKKV